MSELDTFPDILSPFRAAIAATLAPSVAVSLTQESPRGMTQSRFAGAPWWPKAQVYPCDKAGQPLWPILQINFAETPRLDPLPSEGILQFFVGGDFLFGLNCDDLTAPDGFACRFHTDLTQEIQGDFSFLREDATAEYLSPIADPLSPAGLAFALSAMPIGVEDFRFRTLLPQIAEDEDLTDAYFYWLEQSLGDLWLGGHPTFAQTDPRRDPKIAQRSDLTLLTCRATDRLMWGDMGSAQFFMKAEDLRARDFSRVIYNWDCH